MSTLDLLEGLLREMHQTLGKTLDVWGSVEANLCSIYCAAMAPAKYDIASAAFSAILSFEVQIATTNSAINEKFSTEQPVLDRWKLVYKQLEKCRPLRNKLAHGKIVVVLNKSRTPSKHEPRFLPFFHYYTHKDRRNFVHWNTPDITAIQTEFAALTRSLSEFGKTIGASQKIFQTNWIV